MVGSTTIVAPTRSGIVGGRSRGYRPFTRCFHPEYCPRKRRHSVKVVTLPSPSRFPAMAGVTPASGAHNPIGGWAAAVVHLYSLSWPQFERISLRFTYTPALPTSLRY